MDMNQAHDTIIDEQKNSYCQEFAEQIKFKALEFESHCMNSSSDELLKEDLFDIIALCNNALLKVDAKKQSVYQKILNQRKDELVSKLLKKNNQLK
jgi:hypothetical protein